MLIPTKYLKTLQTFPKQLMSTYLRADSHFLQFLSGLQAKLNAFAQSDQRDIIAFAFDFGQAEWDDEIILQRFVRHWKRSTVQEFVFEKYH